jgi:hypothetical protein
MGDSITAGFEVNDEETFVSKINNNCETTHIVGANFGVLGYECCPWQLSYNRNLIKVKSIKKICDFMMTCTYLVSVTVFLLRN